MAMKIRHFSRDILFVALLDDLRMINPEQAFSAVLELMPKPFLRTGPSGKVSPNIRTLVLCALFEASTLVNSLHQV